MNNVICELCYGEQDPDNCELILQSYICGSCLRRAVMHLKGGCFAGGKADPRAERQVLKSLHQQSLKIARENAPAAKRHKWAERKESLPHGFGVLRRQCVTCGLCECAGHRPRVTGFSGWVKFWVWPEAAKYKEIQSHGMPECEAPQ